MRGHTIHDILREEMVVTLQAGAAQNPEMSGQQRQALGLCDTLPAIRNRVFPVVLAILVEHPSLTTTHCRDSR